MVPSRKTFPLFPYLVCFSSYSKHKRCRLLVNPLFVCFPLLWVCNTSLCELWNFPYGCLTKNLQLTTELKLFFHALLNIYHVTDSAAFFPSRMVMESTWRRLLKQKQDHLQDPRPQADATHGNCHHWINWSFSRQVLLEVSCVLGVFWEWLWSVLARRRLGLPLPFAFHAECFSCAAH